MPFRKKPLHSQVALVVSLLSTGLLLAQTSSPVYGQGSQVACQPNGDGTGWVCSGAPPLATTPLSPAASSSATPTARAPISGSGPRQPPASDIDWVDREFLTAEQLDNLPASCCGAFVEPDRPGVDLSADPDDADTLLETELDLIEDASGNISITGQVRFQQGNRTMYNDATTLMNQQEETVLMQGNVEFREPGILLRGSAAYMDRAADAARVEDARYVLHDYGTHGQAASIVFNSNSGLVTIENGDFSRCEPGSQFWRLEARSIVLDQGAGRGYARGARLEVGNVPIFYYPFTLQFPLGEERISGFLAPSTGSTREGGFDFELPYYLNLAPHYDATLSPRLISDRGVMTSAELRYLAGWSMNTVNLSLLANDRLFELDSAGKPTVDSPPTDNRWFVGFEHYGGLGPNWSTFVDYSAVSDVDYFEDLGSSGLNVSSRTHLNRQGRMDFRSDRLQAGLNVQRIQVIDPRLDPATAAVDINKPFDRLPQLTVSTDLPLAGPLRFSLNSEYTRFDRRLNPDLLDPRLRDAGALVTGERLNLEPALTLDWRTSGWFLRPSAKYKQVAYQLQNQAAGTEEAPQVGVAVYSLDSGLIFERELEDGSSTQTLEPRLYYLNSGYQSQDHLPLFDGAEFSFSFNQLFRDDRFSGGDRIGDAEQLALALTSRFIDHQGQEQARFSIGQVHYFADRLVSLASPLQSWVPRFGPQDTRSALLGEAGFAINPAWRLNLDAQWNEETQDLDEGTLRVRHQADSGRILNASYRYRDVATLPGYLLGPDVDPRIQQTDLSAILPLNSNWRFLGRWNYDHANARNLESFAGMEFSNCCATLRLVVREWVHEEELLIPDSRPDRGIFFQFALHGLGNIAGGGISNLLRDGIYGFREPGQNPSEPVTIR
ncbi:MAG: hypothetical protein RLZZ385_82 [Pseudomonadota bacterium]|jgi:LPS-assembly protein